PAATERLGISNWLAGGDRDDARLRLTAQCRAADRALSHERNQRGLRPTSIRQGPLPHRSGRGFLIHWRGHRKVNNSQRKTAIVHCSLTERLFPCHHLKENPMAKPCEHLQDLTAADFPPPRTPGACEECLKEGTRWVELRECQACGHVGCCDSS